MVLSRTVLAKLDYPLVLMSQVVWCLTTILGIVGAVVASYLGQALGWYNAGEGAGLIGATLGAVVVLLVFGVQFLAGETFV